MSYTARTVGTVLEIDTVNLRKKIQVDLIVSWTDGAYSLTAVDWSISAPIPTYGDSSILVHPLIGGTCMDTITGSSPFNTEQTSSGSEVVFSTTYWIQHNRCGEFKYISYTNPDQTDSSFGIYAFRASYPESITNSQMVAAPGIWIVPQSYDGIAPVTGITAYYLPESEPILIGDGYVNKLQILTYGTPSLLEINLYLGTTSLTHLEDYLSASSTISSAYEGSVTIPEGWHVYISGATVTGILEVFSYDINGKVIATRRDTVYFKINEESPFPVTITQTLTPSGNPSTLSDIYIQGVSKVQAAITATVPTGETDSNSIVSVSSDIEGRSYPGTSVTSDYIQESGTISLTTSVVDSRNQTTQAVSSISVVEYDAPQFTVTTSVSNGTATVRLAGSYSSLSGRNSATHSIKWINSNGDSYESSSFEIALNPFDISFNFSINTNYTYKYIVTVTDLVTSVVKTAYVGKPVISRHVGGDGVTFGEEASQSGLIVAEGWDAILKDSVNGDIDLRTIEQRIAAIENQLNGMGVRTLLWSGSSNETITLNSNPLNYDTLIIEYIETASTSGVGVRSASYPMSYASGNKIYLNGTGWLSSTQVWTNISMYHISGTQLILDSFTRTDGYQGANQLSIINVYGIKYIA